MFRKLKIPEISLMLTLFAALILFNGCATSAYKRHPELSLKKETKRIVLMPMDIQLSTITAGGVLKPEAEWTANARQYVEGCLKEEMSEKGVRLISAGENGGVELDNEEVEIQIQLVKLHEAVGYSILLHQYIPALKLPAKETFDWSLGPEAVLLNERYEADYALFVYLRDSYASAGRVVLFIFAAALGVGIPMGQQVGFASLVDLATGDVVWFNRLAREVGDLRKPEPAADSVELLLCDFPE
jgi:hypothetical protein